MKTKATPVVTLLLFSVGSFALTYATAILLARALGADGYDDYAVAVSAATILAALAELGMGKYAMRAVPAYVERGEWPLAKGYGRFAGISIGVAGFVIAAVVAASEGLEDLVLGDYALGIAILFLPAMAWVGAGTEFVMANQAPVRAAFVTRVLVPGSTLLLVIGWGFSSREMSAPGGALCYGLGWLAGLVAIAFFFQRTTHPQVRRAEPRFEVREWFARSMPFLFFALLLTVLAKVGVLVLEIVAQDEEAVALYSAAVETGTLIYIVAKSTDKLFLPQVSILIERKDVAAIQRGRIQRWIWLGSACVVFLLVVFLYGREILELFGPEFVGGYPALLIVAASTSVWTMVSLSPSYLKYVKKNAFVVVATAITVLVHIGLAFPLGYRYGATGAAISYAVAVIGLYGTLSVAATRQLRRMGEP